MQEGTPAFVQMIRISAAIAAHKESGLPYLVYVRHPTTGGVMASWGSLGHITVAEPGALVGFLGPRVFEALYDDTFPEGVQTSENLYAHGIVDAVVPPEEIADVLDRALKILSPGEVELVASPPEEEIPDVDAWEAITRSRRSDRPGVRRLLRYAATDVIPLNGTGEGEADPGLLIALARFGDSSCVFLGQDRRGQTRVEPARAPARCARRVAGCGWRSSCGLPLVTVIDTPGAALSPEAEEGGMAGEIARCLSDLVTLPAPTLVPDARRGQRRWRAGLPAGRPRRRGPARLALTRCRPRGPARSCTATPSTPPRWPGPSTCAPRTCGRAAWSTGSWPSTPTRPTSPRSSASGWARCCATSSPSSPASTRTRCDARGPGGSRRPDSRGTQAMSRTYVVSGSASGHRCRHRRPAAASRGTP